MSNQTADQNASDSTIDTAMSTPSNDELPPTNLDREDNRWGPHHWLRDWAILLMMILTYLIWTGIIYLLEPGIR